MDPPSPPPPSSRPRTITIGSLATPISTRDESIDKARPSHSNHCKKQPQNFIWEIQPRGCMHFHPIHVPCYTTKTSKHTTGSPHHNFPCKHAYLSTNLVPILKVSHPAPNNFSSVRFNHRTCSKLGECTGIPASNSLSLIPGIQRTQSATLMFTPSLFPAAQAKSRTVPDLSTSMRSPFLPGTSSPTRICPKNIQVTAGRGRIFHTNVFFPHTNIQFRILVLEGAINISLKESFMD